MKIVLVKYNAGNYASVLAALGRIGETAIVTDDAKEIESADKVIVPGVGEAGSTMQYLTKRGLDGVIRRLKQPVLGICLGMQILAESSEENDTKCLGILSGNVRRFKTAKKIPQVGWNQLEETKGELFKGIGEAPYMYFVHSYYLELSPETTATTTYGESFAASAQRGNFFAVQFHPERSGSNGETLLRNFIAL